MSYTPDLQQAANSSLDYLRILVMGLSGGGKTSFAATAKKPLILLLEPQGMVSIKTINPEATVIVVDGFESVPDSPGERRAIIDPRTGQPMWPWDHLMRTLAWVKRELDAGSFGWETLVMDSFQDALWLLMSKILKGKGMTDPDDPPTLTLQEYGVLGSRGLDMVRFLKALPIDFIMLTKAEEFVDGEELKVRPGAIGKMAPENLPYHFNLVLHAYKHQRAEGGRPEYFLLTDGHDKYLTKGHPALEPIEIQNADYMMMRVKGSPGAGLISAALPAEGERPTPPTPHEAEKPAARRKRLAEEAKARKQRGRATGKQGAPPPKKKANKAKGGKS